MANRRWIGNARNVAQVDTLTIGGTLEVGDILTATIGDKTFSYSCATTTLATEATSFAAAWNALSSTIWPEFAEITAAATSGGALTLTADTPGKPFTVTVATTESNGGAADSQTFSRSATTANSGQYVFSTASNWEGGTAPVDGDAIIFDSGDVDCRYDLTQSSLSPASITKTTGYRGKIGLPTMNVDNASAPYREYRPTFLKFGDSGDAQLCTVTIYGGGMCKLDSNTAGTTYIIHGSDASSEVGTPTILVKGADIDAITVKGGSVGVAHYPGDTATVAAITVTGGDCRVGSGATITGCAIAQSGGKLEINSATSGGSATITQHGGTLTIQAGASVAPQLYGGTCYYNSSGTLGGNVNIYGKATLDFSQDLASKTVSNPLNLYSTDGVIEDPHGVTGNVVIDIHGMRLSQAKINIGSHFRLTKGAVS